MSPEMNATLRVIAAAIVPPVVATAVIFFSVGVLGEYGWILFLALPMVLGFSSVVIFAPHGDRSFARCFFVSLSSLVTVGVFLVLIAIEGLICLLMTLPIAVPMMALGAFIAYGVTRQWMNSKSATGLSAILFLMLPVMMGFEASDRSEPTLHTVVTTVEIDAPIETVWRNVVAFPRIDAEPEGVLRLGFAYPTDARIEGDGVGAIRYCNFSTGPFVEPITGWEEPNLLAFDVSEQPAPMVELTPYSELHATHLQYIRSQKGQFRLYETNGKTFVEGTTFYTHDIAPDPYWNLFSHQIIQSIHLRVLTHIKTVSETDG
jgi:hypothetical protein